MAKAKTVKVRVVVFYDDDARYMAVVNLARARAKGMMPCLVCPMISALGVYRTPASSTSSCRSLSRLSAR